MQILLVQAVDMPQFVRCHRPVAGGVPTEVRTELNPTPGEIVAASLWAMSPATLEAPNGIGWAGIGRISPLEHDVAIRAGSLDKLGTKVRGKCSFPVRQRLPEGIDRGGVCEIGAPSIGAAVNYPLPHCPGVIWEAGVVHLRRHPKVMMTLRGRGREKDHSHRNPYNKPTEGAVQG